MLKQIVEYARLKGFLSLSIQSYLTNIAIDEIEQLGFISSPRIEFAIDLTRSNDELVKCYSSHHRRKLKKAHKHNLVLKEANTMEGMRDLRRLQIQSRDRRMQRGEFIGMLDDSFYEEVGKKYFRKKLGRVFLMTQGDQAVTAAFVSIYAGRGYYVYGGSSDDGFKMDAPALLFFNIFARCRELGCREFNMGGVPADAVNPESPSHGLYRFKAGFGGKQINCLSLSIENLRPRINSIIRIAKKIFR
jgi:lipid II:glycine glycyltransferase (peptidoglycan interpeptide bridge formation enzyme)